MATSTLPVSGSTGISKADRKVIFASSLGTVFEWYDFYLYGSLAAIISKQFFSGVNETTGFIFALLAFAAGFAVRPFGALVFGRLGDLVGRKHTFLITIVIMGLSTALVGALPSYASVGVIAPIALIVLRLLQGLALGGEYGGAATYVGEHAPPGKRGQYTSWIQTTATLGLFLSLVVILLCRSWLGPQFDAWGWRIPFLVSIVLLAISVYIRLQLAESPVFLEMKAAGTTSKAPLTESFARSENLKLVILALLGATAGQAVVWYGGQFYALFFLTQVLKVDAQPANLLIAGSVAGRDAVLRGLWHPLRPHRSQEDRPARLPVGSDHLRADLQGSHSLRKSRDRERLVARTGERRRRSERLQLPVRSGRQEEIRPVVRYRQGRARQGWRALPQRGCTGGQRGPGPHRRCTGNPLRGGRHHVGRGLQGGDGEILQGAERRAQGGRLSAPRQTPHKSTIRWSGCCSSSWCCTSPWSTARSPRG